MVPILRITVLAAASLLLGAGSSTLASHGARVEAIPGGHGFGDVVLVERRAPFMGTVLGIRVEAPDRDVGIEAIEGAFDAVRESESLLSTWRPDSELALLNGAPVGEPVHLSEQLAPILAKAWRWSRETDGAFLPQIGSLVDVWGLRSGGSIPTPEALIRARRASRTGSIVLVGSGGASEGGTSGRAIVRNDSLAWIDAGGFGKGTALGAAAMALSEAQIGSAVLNFGGQLLVMGSRPQAVGVAHPNDRTRSVVTLEVSRRSVATAGASERRWSVAGRTVTHILDPATGVPAEPWGSVTVVADDPFAADALSTALFVMGPDRARSWAQNREDVGVLVLETTSDEPGYRVQREGGAQGLSAAWNPAMEPHIQRIDIDINDPERG